MKLIRTTLFIILLFPIENMFQNDISITIETEIYSCAMDPTISEQMTQAIQNKDIQKSNSILLTLSKVRPKCIDLHQAIAGNYALLNDLTKFQIYNNKVKFLKTEYQMKTGKLFYYQGN
jgi:hypothetical protein